MKAEVGVEELRRLLEAWVAQEPPGPSGRRWWRNPILVTARADERFDCLARIAAPGHSLPRDLLAGARSVVVYFLPFVESLAAENGPGKRPCRHWGLAYVETNALIGRINERFKAYLAERGIPCALTPATHNFDPVQLTSRWSHKHLGHLSGLGRFGHNSQLITPAGCTGRLGSFVTEADLGDHPLVRAEQACLQRAGRECLACVKRCPVQALTAGGLDRTRCFERLKGNLRDGKSLAGLPVTTHVCGKCVVTLPCSHKDPVAG
jgi:epoxyqueuosine reductase QueG